MYTELDARKSELARVFEDMDLDLIQQSMEVYGSPESSPSSSTTMLSAGDLIVATYKPVKELDEYHHTEVDCRLEVTELGIPYIHNLPPELIALIFAYCVDEDPDSIAVLAQVCWRWNDIAMTTFSLWQRLELSDATFPPGQLRRKVELWTTRSGMTPLDFGMTSDHRDALLPMLSYLARSSHRWRKGTFRGSNSRRMHFEDGKPSEGVNLKRLIIALTPLPEYPTDLHSAFPQSPESPNSPNSPTTTKCFDQPPIQATIGDIYMLPSPELLQPFETITKLSIHNRSDELEMPVHQVVQMLKAFPVLETLEVGNVLSQDPSHPGDGGCRNIEPIVLPHLRSLSLMSICSLRCFLSSITTPVLVHLSLIHTNTSSIYDTELPGEDGDSEDEDHDFSQSPWTDHATGMGLRSLFSRCSPPLRTLIMDYADMRTKDFKWAFRTFRHLEHLRIIASDMSNNVARALEPDPSRNWLPLPRLKVLTINHCQKISGDAFMQMVEKRLEAAERGEVNRLMRVSVVDCMWFSSGQIQELVVKMAESVKAAVRDEMRSAEDVDVGAALKRALTTF